MASTELPGDHKLCAMSQAEMPLPVDEIAAFCRRHHIRELALFGSAIHGDMRAESDIDVLVEFEPGHVPGFGFITIQDELSALLGRPVDLHTPRSLSRYFRDEVLAEAQVAYAGD